MFTCVPAHLCLLNTHTGVSTASPHTCTCGLPHPSTGVAAHISFAHMLTSLPATWGQQNGHICGVRQLAGPSPGSGQAREAAPSGSWVSHQPWGGERARPPLTVPSRPLSHSGHCHTSRDGPRVPGNPAAPGQPPPFCRHQHLLLLPSRPKTQESLADQWAGALLGQGGLGPRFPFGSWKAGRTLPCPRQTGVSPLLPPGHSPNAVIWAFRFGEGQGLCTPVLCPTQRCLLSLSLLAPRFPGQTLTEERAPRAVGLSEAPAPSARGPFF